MKDLDVMKKIIDIKTMHERAEGVSNLSKRNISRRLEHILTCNHRELRRSICHVFLFIV